ncbi:MAG: tRNA (N(6)-L-threonylcarbamoyladenosine(37)-C(2))-methylthiotransferase MtaB [Bdellovibrionales bacterium]|nr:tRNA (N(6)-L-threonylcarbamoyladenosine(37)-C(2))-methylthiotransferase MtaB [Bdellovibrionales bacterium]
MDSVSENRPNPYEFIMHTWGCKVNTYDTGLLQSRLKSAASETSAPRVHVLNTCAVTEEASREAARAVRKIKSREPLAKIVVTGCGAQVDGGIFDALPGADLVIANSHKGQIEELVDRLFKGTLEEKVFRSNIFRKDDLEEGGGLEADHTRAFLKIQDGCNSFCTYCVIPFARGRSRSIPIARIVARLNELMSAGAREVVLTGVHIGDYEDGEKRLEDLVETVLRATSIPRIRLSSLEPVELTDRLLALFENSRLCPHFHMSIQSASTATLERMRRQYTAQDVESALLKIKRVLPNAFVGMDVIVGFPGETDDEFQETYERLARLPWTRIHVFPYSERPGTKALKLEGSVRPEERVRRAQFLRSLSTDRFEQTGRSLIGERLRVMGLRGGRGLSDNYWPVEFESELAPGQFSEFTVTEFCKPTNGRMDGWLKGHAVDVPC